MIFIKEEQLKHYSRIYSKDIFTTMYSDNCKFSVLSQEELYLASISNNDFLNKKESFNKFRTLNINYFENIINNPDENITAKYYYTVIKALISNAKRFGLIKSHSTTISFDLLFKSMKALNTKTYNKKKFKQDIENIKSSSFFKAVNKHHITIETNQIILRKVKHTLYSTRILKKNDIFNQSRFLKECVYFLKSKPLSKHDFDKNTQVIADTTVASKLGITHNRIKQITKNYLKIYQFVLLTEEESNYRKHIEEKYVEDLKIQGTKYGVYSNGSKIMKNIFFKSAVQDKKRNFVMLSKLSNAKTKEYKLRKLIGESKEDNIPVNTYGNVNRINDIMEQNRKQTVDNISNEYLTTRKSLKFNIISGSYKKALHQFIRYTHIIEFSKHLKQFGKYINVNLNKYSIKKIIKVLTGIYLGLKRTVNVSSIERKFKSLDLTLNNTLRIYEPKPTLIPEGLF